MRRIWLLTAVFCVVVFSASAQETSTPDPKIHTASARQGGPFFLSLDAPEASPNRPSNSTSADVLLAGVLQAEYGFSREWGPDSERQNLFGGELRLGLGHNLEIRWGGNDFVRNSALGTHEQGFGDQSFTTQYRFLKQGEATPSIAASYAVKFPTGDEARGLGSGRTDHAFTFLISKEIHEFAVDFNAGYHLIGRTADDGHDQNGFAIFTLSHKLAGPVSAIAEISAESRLGDESAFASTLGGLSWRVHPRFVLDAAIEAGITNGAPGKKISFGFTYSLGTVR